MASEPRARFRKWEMVFLTVGLLFLLGGSVKMVSAAARTQMLFRAYRGLRLQPGHVPATALSAWLSPLGPAWVRVEPHVTMQLDPYDMVSATILATGVWEPDSWGAVARHLTPGATFVDVGAHIGYYSLKAAPLVGAEGRVIAIEPNPQTVRSLGENVRASGASMVTIAPVACWNSEDTLELFAAPRNNTGETSLSRTNASQGGAVATSYRVQARPLDAILRDAGVSRVDVVKIDVEGAEFQVLQGAQSTLDRYHPTVLVELVEEQLKSLGASTAQVMAFMGQHGYAAGHWHERNLEFLAAGQRLN